MSSKSTIPNEKGSQEYTKLLRDEVNETLDIMERNVEGLKEREHKISIGEETALKIKEDAEQFKKLASENKKKFMWQNYKMTIIIACVCIAVICIICLLYTSDAADE